MFNGIYKAVVFFVFVMVITGCKTADVTVIWKTDHIASPQYYKIMVAAIISPRNDSIRSGIEQAFAKGLNDIGYNAVASIKEFGPSGLSSLGEVETYKRLCDYGIDAVLTVALLDERDAKPMYSKLSADPSSFYYNRIWNYSRTKPGDPEPIDRDALWECTLFNLSTLQVESVIQSHPKSNWLQTGFEKGVLAKMLKEKVIQKQVLQLRPF